MRHISIELDIDKKFAEVSIDGCEKYRTKEVDVEGTEGEDMRGFQLETRVHGAWDCPEEDEAAYTEFGAAFRALTSRVIEEACEKIDEG